MNALLLVVLVVIWTVTIVLLVECWRIMKENDEIIRDMSESLARLEQGRARDE